jgi:glycosyltransferase involved in cell wall biosynthesis
VDISVVIPVLNAANILPEQLAALAAQDFPGRWEVILSDNGSTDALEGVVDAWQPRLPGLRIVDASAVIGAGFARDVAVRQSKADRLAFCDADDIVGPGWLAAVYQGLEHQAIITGPLGRIAFEATQTASASELFGRVKFSREPDTRHGVPFASTCNAGYRREALAFGFAHDYLIGEDGATSWRAAQLGYTVGWATDAKILFRDRPRGRRSFRRLVSSGVAGMRQDIEFGGGVLPYRARFPARNFAWLLLTSPATILPGGRRRWVLSFAMALGAAVEYLLPGLWFGMLRRRAHRGIKSDHVAQVES